ncbi:MAG: CotH kinase family protein [Planctomycetota bacterium]
MRHSRILAVVLTLTLWPLAAVRAQQGVRINEFMAVNDNGLDDEDRDEEDWIEIYNAGADTVDLSGWYLTDNLNNLTKWAFPPVTLVSGDYLIVFASGKDRRDPVLHTNFKLRGSGEYLALVRPDGHTVVSEFFPMFPIQAPDVSYGFSAVDTEVALVAAGAPAKALVPLDDALEPVAQNPQTPRPWTLETLDDSGWDGGVTGVGFAYPQLIGLDVSAMSSVNQTVYVRIPFELDHPSGVDSLSLSMRYEDGMIAYINGREVARSNAPAPGEETWNSGSSAYRVNRIAVHPVDYPIEEFDFLRAGTNVLAVQGLNYIVDSPNLLILPELVAQMHLYTDTPPGYFMLPTPGKPNNLGVEKLGPIISDSGHYPEIPRDNDDLLITVRITPSFGLVDRAELHYRVMFENEVTVPLSDDGTNGDGAAGDRVYGARIGARSFRAGQMVRWSITATDTAGRQSHIPTFLDPLNSPQYFGTIVDDPSLANPMPVLHWFIENPGAANNDIGTRCALYYDGEFYDNVWINIHGQSSRGFPKKSYDIDFHPGYNFKWAPGQPRADDINLMTTYPDKAHMRNILAYDVYRDADCPYHWVFPVRVQQNGAFWGTAHVMENGDEDWLIRMGLNAEGALYKMYNTFTTASHTTTGAEKKTRKDEDNADLLELYNGLGLSGESRRRYLYDNVDIPQVINFLAARIITGDVDCCHKNYYFYRDTGASNEWQMWPWDVDLSFGRVWNSSETYWNENLVTSTGLFVGQNNRLPSAIFSTPEMRQMYLRRVRTLMDELLKAPDTPPQEELYFEPRIDMLALLIGPDAELDATKWGSDAWGNGSTASCCPQSLWEAVEELKNSYLPERRRHMFNRMSQIPDAQPDRVVVSIGAVETDPVSGNLDEQYIQLQNLNSFAVDISGWTLSREQAFSAHLFTFRGGTVIPANGTIYVAANRVALRSQRSSIRGGGIWFIVGDFSGRLAARDETIYLTDRQHVTVDSVVTTQNPGR